MINFASNQKPRKNSAVRKIPVLLTILFSAVWAPVHAAEFSVGVVPQFTTQKINDIWTPLLQALSETTGDSYSLVIESDINEFESAFQRGDYDFAYMNPWHAVIANREQGYLPILRDGARMLTGILVVQADSGISDVSQLVDPEIAFPSPKALGASLLMRAELAVEHGIDVSRLYVRTHPSVYLNVALGKSVAGGGVMRTLRAQPQSIQDALRVIYETREVAPHPVSAHPRVDEKAVARFQKAAVELRRTARGRELFAAVPMQAPQEATMEDYTPLTEWRLEDFYVAN